MYHLTMVPVRVRWKRRNRMESSLMEFEEYHR